MHRKTQPLQDRIVAARKRLAAAEREMQKAAACVRNCLDAYSDHKKAHDEAAENLRLLEAAAPPPPVPAVKTIRNVAQAAHQMLLFLEQTPLMQADPNGTTGEDRLLSSMLAMRNALSDPTTAELLTSDSTSTDTGKEESPPAAAGGGNAGSAGAGAGAAMDQDAGAEAVPGETRLQEPLTEQEFKKARIAAAYCASQGPHSVSFSPSSSAMMAACGQAEAAQAAERAAQLAAKQKCELEAALQADAKYVQ